MAVNRPMPDQRKMVFHLAERLAQQALDGDVAAMREVIYCLDGKPGISGAEDGSTTISFVVRLPQQLDADEWQAMANPRPARIVDVSAVDSAQAESASDPELAAVELAADLLAADVEPPGDGHQGGDGLLGMVKRAQEPAK